jgi:hypothetical protein
MYDLTWLTQMTLLMTKSMSYFIIIAQYRWQSAVKNYPPESSLSCIHGFARVIFSELGKVRYLVKNILLCATLGKQKTLRKSETLPSVTHAKVWQKFLFNRRNLKKFKTCVFSLLWDLVLMINTKIEIW